MFHQNKSSGVRGKDSPVDELGRSSHRGVGSYESIANILNAEGIKPKKGAWFATTVKRVLLAHPTLK
jgi:hypothetical protein